MAFMQSLLYKKLDFNKNNYPILIKNQIQTIYTLIMPDILNYGFLSVVLM